MDRQLLNRKIQYYIRDVEQSIQEPIMTKTLGRMPLDDAKAFFLLLPLLNGEEWSEELHVSALAVGAVHAAFDIHDKVDILDASSKEQQLMVLSGDHFSGIHYKLLASISDFAFITSMSEMIGRINETKTNLLMEEVESVQALIQSMTCIESGCISEFLNTYGFSRYTKITQSALALIWFSRKFSKNAIVRYGWTGNSMSKTDVEKAISVLTTILQEELVSAEFLSPFLKQEILRLATPLLGKPI